MALREFTDSRGTAWTAWDVPPHRVYTPARSGVERRTRVVPGWTPERRVLRDRRLRLMHPERRVLRDRRLRLMHPELTGGWVCFATGGEKRRLSPPPPRWHRASDQELEALCRQAADPRTPAAP